MEHDLSKLIPDIRRLNDMRPVLADENFAKTAEDCELYYIYRGLEQKDGLRYDVTIIPPKTLGDEFVKTKGHYHVGAYSEIYTVLEGSAIYLMQKIGRDGNIEDIYAVEARKGNSIVIPPFYGHVTINPSRKESLKMANWLSQNCKSDYSLYERMRGAGYYFTKRGWIKNENYGILPGLRREKPLKSAPENLDFLRQG